MKEIIEAIENSSTVVEAAIKLKISRKTLYRRLKDHNLKVVRDHRLKVVENGT